MNRCEEEKEGGRKGNQKKLGEERERRRDREC